MVWPFSSSGNNSSPSLDANLEQFVKSQGSSKYETTSKPDSQPSQPTSSNETSSRPNHAKRSAFSDGRYDHLWSTYRSPTEVDSTNKTDQEKASDLLDFHRHRNESIKSAAMENCSPELFAQWDCTRGGPWARRATMCRAEQKEIGRCLMMQGRFLRALGYLSEHGRPPEVEEDVQLHADDLYRKMLRMEKMAKEARDAGVQEEEAAKLAREAETVKALTAPVPTKGEIALKGQVFFPRDAVDKPDDPALPAEAEVLKPEAIKDIKDKLKALGPLERALERAAIANDIKHATTTMQGYDFHQQKAQREREERRVAGTATLGDRISGLLGR